MQSKKIKRLILFMLLFSLTAIPLYGCSSNNSEQAAEKSEFKDGKFNPPVTINYVREVGNEIKFRDGETINDNVHTRWAKDELGIIINHPWTTPGGSDQFSQKIRLSLSANEELPDVMMVNGTLLTDLVDSGKFLSIDEAIDQFASDRLKALYKQFPESFYSAMKDGKRYGLPVFSGGNGSDPVMWIRQDWLDKLQMKAPTTLAELEQLMDAFVNKDPDGNNKKDTVALAIGSSIASWIADSSFLWGALGSHGLPFRWYENSEGKLQYGSIVPETKAALGKLKEWTDKGYVDKDFMINDSGKAAERFTAAMKESSSGQRGWLVGRIQMSSRMYQVQY